MRFWICSFIIFLGSIFSSCTAAYWMRGDGRRWLVASFLTAQICELAWYLGAGSDKNPGLARISVIIAMVHMIGGVLSGAIIANEKVDMRLYLAVVVGLVAVLLASGSD